MTEENKKENIKATGSRTKGIGEEVVTKAELRDMLYHADVRHQSLFLTLASSGLRIAEVLQLIPEDINFDNDPVLVTVRGELRMDRETRITFLSYEASESVKKWLKVRQQYLMKVSHSVSNMKKLTRFIDDRRVFPYSTNTVQKMWQKMFRDSGYADKTKNSDRHKYHLPAFRIFFYSNLTAMIPDSTAAYLMGWNEKGSSIEWEQWDAKTETLGEMYKKAMPALTIFEPTDPANV